MENIFVPIPFVILGLIFFFKSDWIIRLRNWQFKTYYNGQYTAGKIEIMFWKFLGLLIIAWGGYSYFYPPSIAYHEASTTASIPPTWLLWLVFMVTFIIGIVSVFKPMWIVNMNVYGAQLIGSSMTPGNMHIWVRIIGAFFLLWSLFFGYKFLIS